MDIKYYCVYKKSNKLITASDVPMWLLDNGSNLPDFLGVYESEKQAKSIIYLLRKSLQEYNLTEDIEFHIGFLSKDQVAMIMSASKIAEMFKSGIGKTNLCYKDIHSGYNRNLQFVKSGYFYPYGFYYMDEDDCDEDSKVSEFDLITSTL